MPKFIAVTEDIKTPEVPKVVFKAWTDTDGDFLITANGHLVAVFASETGKLDLYGAGHRVNLWPLRRIRVGPKSKSGCGRAADPGSPRHKR